MTIFGHLEILKWVFHYVPRPLLRCKKKLFHYYIEEKTITKGLFFLVSKYVSGFSLKKMSWTPCITSKVKLANLEDGLTLYFLQNYLLIGL